jgi:hypothetical protein
VKTLKAAALAAALGLAITACGASGHSGNMAACRAAVKKADIAAGNAIMAGDSNVPAFRTPGECAGLSDAQIAGIHAKLMSDGY